MGGYFSKEEELNQPQMQLDKKHDQIAAANPSTPISAQRALNPFKMLGPKDPRSPSTNIIRTPLIFLNRTQSLNDLTKVNESLVVETKSLNLADDPRSPTMEFARTPIIIETKVQPTENNKPHNKNLDNVLNAHLISTTPVLIKRTCQSEKKKIAPKLLESSPIAFTTSTTANKRKSFVGLLETNIDFTETDLDDVIKTKECLNRTCPDKINEESISPISNQIKKQMERLNEAEPTDIIETSTFVLVKDLEGVDEPLLNIEKPIIEPQHIETKEKPDEFVNVTAQVNNFDKKLTNLIFEDEEIINENMEINKKNDKNKDNSCRTPLRVRNCIDNNNKKGCPKLKVSDKPRNYVSSKIPVLRNNSKKTQNENTPPSIFDGGKKLKSSHWDSDKTIVI